VLALAVVAVVAISSLGGSSPKHAATPSAATVTSAHVVHAKAKPKPATKQQPAAFDPAETTVTVLNGTETTGLAHHVSEELQQTGFSQATALNGRPPGTNQVTVVEYASGHQAEAGGVAHSLSVAHVEPMESSVAALAGSASVVVIVGQDKAASSP
jgi:hypothetical protein